MNKILVQIERVKGGFVVLDALGREHRVKESEIAAKLIALMSDDGLPDPQVETRDNAVGFLASVARRVFPQRRELVDTMEPFVHQATALGRKIRQTRQGAAE